DAAIKMQRLDHRLAIAPEWDPQQGQFGYRRQLRYVFFDQGGHVAIAKRYRQHAQKQGLFKTLAQKREENPEVDRLIGAVNVWNWDSNPVELVKELQAAGIQRILWSKGGSPDSLRTLNAMGVLTSRYDIYQDVMDPANFPLLNWIHPDWTTDAWPKDIILKADGDWLHGWGVKAKNGQWYDCGVICDRRALQYARKRIPAELATHPYKCRFIDTTTAAPWNECYNTNHPMTHSESREWKMKLLECVSREFKLVTGCETGHDASVPFLHYFEGMLSLGPYRVPDAGRDMQQIWDNPPERVVKYQLGHTYRLPLWELVYHDCVVSQWYWGDYNNKLPSLWDKRDLFNVLYGTPPMFMFNRKLWQAQKDRFAKSYRNTIPCARATGYSEMTDHRFLTPDRSVQQTAFANGVVVTVNFGTTPFPMPSGRTLLPLEYDLAGMPNEPERAKEKFVR
ncbi:MAG TPA: glycoside hydrolase, partial [Clostridia bacterium]|nr:glycoside hydrolase [Clostridia bacterium]